MVKILLAEDNQTLRELFAAVLRSAGYELCTARDGAAALKWLGREKFFALVTDIVMPDMNGIELYARVKEIDPELAAHTILITGALDAHTRAFLEQNKIPCLFKPFEVKRLLEFLDRFARVPSA